MSTDINVDSSFLGINGAIEGGDPVESRETGFLINLVVQSESAGLRVVTEGKLESENRTEKVQVLVGINLRCK